MPVTVHSPADVVRWMIVGLGLGTDPSAAAAWPVYAEGEPPAPDETITVYTTDGVDSPRTMSDGATNGTCGFQVRVRSVRHDSGFQKASEIANKLTDPEFVRNLTVTVGASDYLVYSVDYTGNVIPLGKESPDSRRSLFTVNAQVTFDPAD
jgi:hypothetical protein